MDLYQKPRTPRWLLAVIALCIPVLFFALLEGGLRLAGFGDSYPLFIPVEEAPGYLQANPDVVKRFVVDESRTPHVSIRPVPFPAHKPPGTFRIFLQGGSSAAGWPYGFGASPAGMLQQRLNRTFPGRNIEVITTAMPAVNSYTLLDFADEIIARQPDAVLIYAGHNEFLGILGVGSAVSAGRTRPVVQTYLALRELRILQLLKHGYSAVKQWKPLVGKQHRESGGTLMRRIVGESHIPLDSPLYRRGVAQFRSNLAALLARYRAAGVPVYIGTLVSNEKDLEPFINGLVPGTDEATWRRTMAAGRDAFRNGDLGTARSAIEEAVSQDDTAALGWFALGKVLERQEDYPAARRAYLAAKDRDQLRFRAPEVFNAIIREVAAAGGARVVEVQTAFLDRSPHGIIGNELILEHLHPNLEGYFLLADAFYEALRQSGAIGSWAHAVPGDEAWADIPVTVVDELKGEYEITRLLSDRPFQFERITPRYPPRETDIERLAYRLFKGNIAWTGAMEELQAHYLKEQDRSAAARVAVLLADARPYRAALQLSAGSLSLESGQPDEAARLMRRTLRQQPDQPEQYLDVLVRACRALDDDACVRRNLERLYEVDPDNPEVQALSAEPAAAER